MKQFDSVVSFSNKHNPIFKKFSITLLCYQYFGALTKMKSAL